MLQTMQSSWQRLHHLRSLDRAAFRSISTCPVMLYVRKPRWYPQAKSKVYRVVDRPVIPEQDQLELKRLLDQYRTQLKSIRQYMIQTHTEKMSNQSLPGHVLQPEQEEEEHRQLMEYNRQENARLAELRSQRLSEEEEAVRRRVDELARIRAEKQVAARERALRIIQMQKEASKQYIPRENLAQVIEQAFNSPTDYNYAIDREGNRFYGRNNLTEPTPASSLEAAV